MRGVFTGAAVVFAVGVGALGSAPASSAQHDSLRASHPRVLHLVDNSRQIRLPNGQEIPRPLTTFLWYPPGVAASGARPLIVFGHGFATTPFRYRRLLRAWAAAGYLVAAPVFPLGNAHAPGGPDENDIVNQPPPRSPSPVH